MICSNGTWVLSVVGILFAIPLITLAAEYEDYDYYYDCGDCCDYEKDYCKINEHECDTCQHKKFPKETIQDKCGENVKACCAGHGYIFRDQCEVIILSLRLMEQLTF